MNASQVDSLALLIWCSGTNLDTHTVKVHVQLNANPKESGKGRGINISESRQQCSNKDAQHTDTEWVPCLYELPIVRDTVVVDIRDWRVYRTYDFKMTSLPVWTQSSPTPKCVIDPPVHWRIQCFASSRHEKYTLVWRCSNECSIKSEQIHTRKKPGWMECAGFWSQRPECI